MAAQDFGIIISQPGVSVTGAPTSQIVMNTSNPFIKLDTQNPKAFQQISLIITTNPPEPSGAGDTYTVVYFFVHGYKYVPSLETLYNVTTAPPGTTFSQTYFQDWGQLGGMTVADGAFLYAIADATNVYFIIDKYNAGGGSANLLTGTNVSIGVHVFVDDIGIT